MAMLPHIEWPFDYLFLKVSSQIFSYLVVFIILLVYGYKNLGSRIFRRRTVRRKKNITKTNSFSYSDLSYCEKSMHNKNLMAHHLVDCSELIFSVYLL